MSLINFTCRSCGAKCWSYDRDVVSCIRVAARLCSSCDSCAEEDVRVRFGAVVRREQVRLAPAQEEQLPTTLGLVLAALIVLTASAVFVAEFAVEACLIGAILAGIGWFAQIAGRFLA